MIFRDLIVMIVLIVTASADFFLNVIKKLDTKWNYLLFVPLLICVVHLLCSNKNLLLYPVYAGAVLLALGFFLKDKRVLEGIIAGAVVILAVLPVIALSVTKSKCYASLGYVAAFTQLHEDMKENYALQGWKETDFDELYEAWLPLIKDAQQRKDKNQYVSALRYYMASYQDGHVQLGDLYETLGIGSTRNIQNVNRMIFENYYGMFLLQLDSGEYAAVNVSDGGSAQKAGIQNGTIITGWDGKTIEDHVQSIDTLLSYHCTVFADCDNKKRFQPFYASCLGSKEIAVTFLDEAGKEQTASLAAMKNGYESLYYTIGYFLHKPQNKVSRDSLSYQTLDGGIGYLKISEMTSDYASLKQHMDSFAEQMKNDHITSLIIDMRNNSGGEDKAGALLTEYFAKNDFCYLIETAYDPKNKQYIEHTRIDVKARNEIALPVMLLVNSDCISAGEGFVYNMAKLSQVTVVGMTGTNGSFGSIDGAVLMPEGLIAMYPSIACVDESSVVMIDSKQNNTGGIKPDIVIPIDETAIKLIFDDDHDYELEYVLGLLKVR